MESAKDLFELSVNSSGKDSIIRFAKLVKWIIAMGILITFLSLVTNFIRLFYLQPLLKDNSFVKFSSLVESYWLFVYLILFLIQIFLLGRVGKDLSSAINANDEETLSKAFRHLYHYTLIGLVGLIGGVIFAGFEVFVSFKFYKLL